MTNKTCEYKTFTEDDWNSYRKKIPIWQENYTYIYKISFVSDKRKER